MCVCVCVCVCVYILYFQSHLAHGGGLKRIDSPPQHIYIYVCVCVCVYVCVCVLAGESILFNPPP